MTDGGSGSLNAKNCLKAAWNLIERIVGEDVGHYGGSYKVTYDLYKKYGEMRLLDTPICGALLPQCSFCFNFSNPLCFPMDELRSNSTNCCSLAHSSKLY